MLVKTNFQVVASQIDKIVQVKEPELAKYTAAMRSMKKYFLGFTVKCISRNDNSEADDLAKAVAQKLSFLSDVFQEILKIPAVDAPRQMAHNVTIIESEDWRSSIMAYLQGHYKPEDQVEAKRMVQRAKNYQIVEANLYKMGVYTPML